MDYSSWLQDATKIGVSESVGAREPGTQGVFWCASLSGREESKVNRG